jgi:hypothetical protein
MLTKLITACMAIAAFAAFVLPATASAANSPDLTEGATRVAVGSTFVGTPIGEITYMATDGTTILNHCSSAKLQGTVETNSAGTVKGKITTFDFQGTGGVHADNGLPECTGSFGNLYFTMVTNPLFLESTPAMAEDEFQVSSTGGGNIKFIFASTTAGACEYESTSTLKGDYTTGETTKVTVRNTQAGNGSKLLKGGFLCPTSMQWNWSFYLETTNGTELGIS